MWPKHLYLQLVFLSFECRNVTTNCDKWLFDITLYSQCLTWHFEIVTLSNDFTAAQKMYISHLWLLWLNLAVVTSYLIMWHCYIKPNKCNIFLPAAILYLSFLTISQFVILSPTFSLAKIFLQLQLIYIFQL